MCFTPSLYTSSSASSKITQFILDTDSIFDYSKPTMLENFSRTVRNHIPSSISIPAAAPAASYISRPITACSFMPSAPLSTTSLYQSSRKQ